MTYDWTIKAQGLTKTFGERRALDNIELGVKAGQVLAVLGHNGAGKTTLIKILATIMKPSSGALKFGGMAVKDSAAEIRHLVGVATHESFLYNDLTVYENLAFYCQMYNIKEAKERIHELMAKTGMTPHLYERAGYLSHGMQQRVSVARSLLHRPRILLADEPNSGLDPQAVELVWHTMMNDESTKRTIVFTTTEPEVGLKFGERIIILNEGRIIYDELKSDLDRQLLQQTYEHCMRH
jgi:ABC-type multidrug transport system ATPase subunit